MITVHYRMDNYLYAVIIDVPNIMEDMWVLSQSCSCFLTMLTQQRAQHGFVCTKLSIPRGSISALIGIWVLANLPHSTNEHHPASENVIIFVQTEYS